MSGRPSAFSEDVAEAICGKLAEGQSLRSICESDSMPTARTVHRWLADDVNEAFRQQYAHARELQADALVDEILQIADDAGLQEAFEVQQAKLRVDARKWIASKLVPKKYGDRTLVGSDPENPLPTAIPVLFRDV